MHLFYTIFLYLFALCASSVPFIAVAEPNSYTVNVRQTGHPNFAHYTKKCIQSTDLCHLFMGIKNKKTKQDMELQITLLERQEGFYVQFKSGSDYLFLQQQDKTAHEQLLFLPKSTSLTKQLNQIAKEITLFQQDQNKQAEKDPLLNLLVLHPHDQEIGTISLELSF